MKWPSRYWPSVPRYEVCVTMSRTRSAFSRTSSMRRITETCPCCSKIATKLESCIIALFLIKISLLRRTGRSCQQVDHVTRDMGDSILRQGWFEAGTMDIAGRQEPRKRRIAEMTQGSGDLQIKAAILSVHANQANRQAGRRTKANGPIAPPAPFGCV